MRLRESLREAKGTDGRPLVATEERLLPHRLSLPPAEEPRWRSAALLVGLALALAVTWLGARRPRLLAGLALPFWLVAGLAGSLMAFIWLGTEHFAGHGNENLLLLSPLAFGLLPGGWRVLRGREGGRVFRILLWTLAGLAAVAGFLKFLPFRPQQNVEWVLLLLPLHLALARRLAPRS
jgi:type VI protein secretion system component VasF